MKITKSIKELFTEIDEASTDAKKIILCMELMKHPKLKWEDLLECFKYKVIVAEQAAFKMHDFLSYEVPERGIIKDVNKWVEILKKKDIDIHDVIKK